MSGLPGVPTRTSNSNNLHARRLPPASCIIWLCWLVSGLSCNGKETTQPPADTTAPAAVSDLAAGTPTASSLTLTWTAVGGDGTSGTAAHYDIRYSLSAATVWSLMTQAAGEPSPRAAGQAESFIVSGLASGTTYHFRMKVADEVPNWSVESNEASGATAEPGADTTPPGAVSDLAAGMATASSLTLTWTAVGDDGTSGTAAQYDIRYALSAATAWDQMTQLAGEPSPRTAGQAESFIVSGLASSTTYHFRMKVADEIPNWSVESNEASGATAESGPTGGMVWIPAGSVRLGQQGIDDAFPHDVGIGGFYIDVCEVSNGEYKAFIDAGGYQDSAWWNPVGWNWRVAGDITLPAHWNSNEYHGGGIPANERFPVNGVSWWEADAYARWAGKRLPTEAEWEKAAKGGCEKWGDPGQCDAADTPTYPWGEGIIRSRANCLDSADPYEDNGWTTPIGYYDGSNHGGYQTIDSPSPYGLYDVAGNVWEWTSTKYESYFAFPDGRRENPPGTYNECCRVLRGGSWDDATYSLRCAYRNYNYPNARSNSIGFRCARSGP